MISKRILGRNDPKALAASFLGDETVPALTGEQLENNAIPVLALIGEKDFFKGIVDKMASVMNHLEVLIIPKADHMQAAGRPEFITGLLGFLIKHGE
jgi:pimeloyl-ACP methyl ester carboxylesterase